MKQAVHIFRKDVRHLWLHIAVILALVAVHAALDIARTPLPGIENQRVDQMANLSSFLLTLAWWYLVASAIYGEVLTDDQQFWLTRPYSWKSLLGAKVLFVLAVVNVPLLISDCVILAAQGFPVMINIPDLLLRQLLFCVFLILPSIALAAVTNGVAQFVLTWLLIFILMMVRAFLWHGNAVVNISGGVASDSIGPWIEFGVIVAIALLILFLQYAKRRTLVSRIVIGGYLVVLSPALSALPEPRETLFKLHARSNQIDVSQLRVDFDSARKSSGPGNSAFAPYVPISLPLRVIGVPARFGATGYSEITVDTAEQHSLRIPRFSGFLAEGHRGYLETFWIAPDVFKQIAAQRVALRSKLFITLVTNRPAQQMSPSPGEVWIPSVAVCRFAAVPFQILPMLYCRAGVHNPPVTDVRIEYPGYRSDPQLLGGAGTPGSLYSGLTPVEKWSAALNMGMENSSDVQARLEHPGAQIVFTPHWPVAYAIREWKVQDIDLNQFVVHGQTRLMGWISSR